jgi:hypothetical protein
VLTFYFHAWWILGRAPHYDVPDPKDLSIYKSYTFVTDIGCGIWFFGLILWIALMILYFAIRKFRKNEIFFQTPLVLSTGANILAIVLWFSDIMEWLID